MEDLEALDVRIGDRWGALAVLLETPDRGPLRAPLPEQMAPLATVGRGATAFLHPRGALAGWSIPAHRVGARMHAEQDPDYNALTCQGACKTLWYLIMGDNAPPDENCLTCGGNVTASVRGERTP